MDFMEIMNKHIHYLFTQEEFLGKPPQQEKLHSGKITYIREEKEFQSELFEVSTVLETPLDDVIDFNLEKFCCSIFYGSEETLNQAMKGYFRELGKISDFTGNTVDAKGTKFSHNLFLDALEKIEIPFDENDNPILPQLVVNPSMQKTLNEMKLTEDQVNRQKKIIETKREEYLAKKCYRKLSKVSY